MPAAGRLPLTVMNSNLKIAKELIRPVLRSPISQMVISFVVGYYATTKLVQIYDTMQPKPSALPHEASAGSQSDLVQQSDTNSIVVRASSLDRQLPRGSTALLLTAKQLMAYNGVQDNQPVYTALNGKIYDLSTSREKFSNQGPYSLLAGCNANQVLNIACGSMGVSTDDVVQRWEQSLNAEFNIIGYLIDSEPDVDDDDDDDASTVVGQSDSELTHDM